MDRNERDDRTEYSSRETPGEGTEGFNGGGDVGSREEFSGRPNLTEEREKLAVDPGQAPSEDVERDALQFDQQGSRGAP